MKKQTWLWGIFLIGMLISSLWANTNNTHFLGFHTGFTSGTGLCYRKYEKTYFAWQISLFPLVQEERREEKFLFWSIRVGTFEQFFLHFTKLDTQAIKGTFFLWVGGSASYQYMSTSAPPLSEEQYIFALGGGPGFEVTFYDHFVLTIAGGYATIWTSPSRFEVNFTGEYSFGYRF